MPSRTSEILKNHPDERSEAFHIMPEFLFLWGIISEDPEFSQLENGVFLELDKSKPKGRRFKQPWLADLPRKSIQERMKGFVRMLSEILEPIAHLPVTPETMREAQIRIYERFLREELPKKVSVSKVMQEKNGIFRNKRELRNKLVVSMKRTIRENKEKNQGINVLDIRPTESTETLGELLVKNPMVFFRIKELWGGNLDYTDF